MELNNRDNNGDPFAEDVIQHVWEKGKVIEGNSPAIWRADRYSYFMKRDDYCERNSRYGWEINHIRPFSAGGDDSLENLQPLQWENNNLGK
jgi:hypothetical protein